MKYRKRFYYTEADKALMWDRWQKGDTLHEIARLFDRHHSSVRGILERTGGIRPPVRRRSSLVEQRFLRPVARVTLLRRNDGGEAVRVRAFDCMAGIVPDNPLHSRHCTWMCRCREAQDVRERPSMAVRCGR